jgi:hypothetical protein
LYKVEFIDFERYDQYTNVGLKAIARHCPQLTNILVRSNKITDMGLLAIVEHCPHLTSISLGHRNQFSNAVLQAITRQHSQLSMYFYWEAE